MDLIEEQEALLKNMPLTAFELNQLAWCRRNLYTYTGIGSLLGFFGGLTMGNINAFYLGHGSERLGRVGKVAIGACTAIAGGCLGAAYGIQQAHRHLSELPDNSELAKQVNRLLELQGKCRQAGRRLRGAEGEADHDFERHLNQNVFNRRDFHPIKE